ncbi:hypothetical protein AB3R30_25250 [Leptolyngbyaceae cyanobacterium UHCC 1019]
MSNDRGFDLKMEFDPSQHPWLLSLDEFMAIQSRLASAPACSREWQMLSCKIGFHVEAVRLLRKKSKKKGD